MPRHSDSYSVVLPNFGRDCADHEGGFYEEDLVLWRDLSQHLKHFTYDSEDLTAKVTVDWSPLVRRIVRLTHKNVAISDRSTEIQIDVELKPSAPKSEFSDPAFDIAKRFLCDTYLIANLSVPGTFNLQGASLHTTGKSEFLDLSGYDLDFIWHEMRANEWPPVGAVPLERVLPWFKRLGIGLRSSATTGIERALFSMHYLATHANPISLVWIWQALESLYEGKPGIHWRTLHERVELLLAPPDQRKSGLKKQLRALFDLRSEIVHGRFPVLYYETVGESADKQLERVLSVYWFGIGLILCTVQTMIKRDWTTLSFRQELGGS